MENNREETKRLAWLGCAAFSVYDVKVRRTEKAEKIRGRIESEAEGAKRREGRHVRREIGESRRTFCIPRFLDCTGCDILLFNRAS